MECRHRRSTRPSKRREVLCPCNRALPGRNLPTVARLNMSKTKEQYNLETYKFRLCYTQQVYQHFNKSAP